MDTTIGARIARARRDAALSRRRVAMLLDTTEERIARWERGTTSPPAALILRIAEALGVDPAWLITGGQ